MMVASVVILKERMRGTSGGRVDAAQRAGDVLQYQSD